MRQHDLNVFCIQEIRCPLEKLPECPEGYHAFWFPGEFCLGESCNLRAGPPGPAIVFNFQDVLDRLAGGRISIFLTLTF